MRGFAGGYGSGLALERGFAGGYGSGLALERGFVGGYGGGVALARGFAGGYGAATFAAPIGPVTAAVHSRRTYSLLPTPSAYEAPIPQVIEVEPNEQPVHFVFKTASSPLTVQQVHTPGYTPQYEATRSEEAPHLLSHEIYKPIIQEVREVIQPFRKQIQEVKPVIEEVHTVVAKGEPKLRAAYAAPIAPLAAPLPLAAPAYAAPAPVLAAPAYAASVPFLASRPY